MLNATFRLFEAVCNELAGAESVVLTRDDFVVDGPKAPLMDDLDFEYRRSDDDGALNDAVAALSKHFESRGASLPFSYESSTGRFTARDPKFIDFVDLMRSIRSNPKMSSEFERKVTERLALRTTGVIHRVGWQRTKNQTLKKFNQYLQKQLGFTKSVVGGKEKDGGLDIIWAPPIGAFPHRPLVSVQCKNGEYDRPTADASLGTTKSSLDRQDGLFPDVHLYCVMFNDYITPENLPEKRIGFVPLGISDLAQPLKGVEYHVL
jgi:hypothetical protein